MNTDTTVPGYGFYLKKAYGPDPEPKKKKKKKKKMYVLKGSWMLGGNCESRKIAKFTSKRKAEDYIKKSTLKTPRIEGYKDFPFRLSSLIGEFEWVTIIEEKCDLPIDPE